MVETTEAPLSQASPSRRKWSREEYERMIDAGILEENSRFELIAGEILARTMHNGPHATAIMLGDDAFRTVAAPGFHLRVQLPLALDPDSAPEPDLAIIAGSVRAYRVTHPTSASLVVEVADSSLAFDRSWKASIYARAGIADYWIVNLVDRLLEVYRDPAADSVALLGYAYRQRLSFGPNDRVAPLAFPDVTIAVSDLLP